MGFAATRNLLLSLLLAEGSGLVAGPPFLTDDPQPVDPGHLELYLFAAGQRTPGEGTGIAPAVEFNYGILADTQLHLVLPWAYDRPQDAPVRAGLGDTELGIKFRFLQETDVLPQIGVFPHVEIATGSADRNLGSWHTQVFLPLWIQKGWGPWTSYGGYGWGRNPGPGNQNWNYAGWLLQRDLGESLTLGLEAFRTTSMTVGGRPSTGFNAGGQVNLSTRHHLLFSCGRDFRGATKSNFYVGYQFTAGPFGRPGDRSSPPSSHSSGDR